MVTLTAPASSPATLATVRRYRWPLPWRSVATRALALWLVTRTLDVLLTVLFTSGSAAVRLGRWAFWDAWFYGELAQRGYVQPASYHAPFFPLYPLLLHPFQGLPPVARMIADLLVANMGALAALVLVGLLAAYERRDDRAAWMPMLLLATSPLGVFLAGPYTDGLFVALAAGALLAARRRMWTWAALAMALAVVTRPFGVLLVPALLAEYASQRGWWWQLCRRVFTAPAWATVREGALLLLAPAATLGAFVVVLWTSYGDPLAPIHVQNKWGHELRWPWQTLGLAWNRLVALPHWSWPTTHLLLDLLPVLLCLGVAILTARRAPLAFTVLTLGVVLLCLVTPMAEWPGFPDPVTSDGRYCFAAVPVLLQLGAWIERWPRWVAVLLVSLSLVLQGILTVFVLRGGWLV